MFYPQYAQTVGHIPDDISIPEFIFQSRPKDSLEIAFVDSSTGEKRTWKDVQSKTRQLARGLAKLFKVSVGDTNVFGLFAPNVWLEEIMLIVDHGSPNCYLGCTFTRWYSH